MVEQGRAVGILPPSESSPTEDRGEDVALVEQLQQAGWLIGNVVLRGEGSGWSKKRAIDAIDRINLEFIASRLLCQDGGGKEVAVIGAFCAALRREINRGSRKDQAGDSAAQAGGVRRQEV
ncbi:MAG: hypothetical protein JO116_21440 [Planctomycetaceae bacterium]|nr:hypothetical protein [Planctomycetaceae bacterium]